MIRLAAIYFGSVFAAGFVLGVLRVMFLVPLVGTRNAELLEIPLMLFWVYFVARWVAQRTRSRKQAFRVGSIALVMLLCAKVLLAAMLFGKWPMDALLNKDPISGTAYYLSLAIFAVMPGLVQADRAI